MKAIRRIILPLIMVLALADAGAKTVSWAISPKYQLLKRYHDDIFVFQHNGKWGMVKPGNNEISPATYEFITPFVNGYALAGSKEGTQYLLQGIISESGDVATLSEKLYLPPANHYFSEGKLAVANRNGKFGYINPSGQMVIRCQFDHALPFKEGWAPVREGNYFKYINESYDRNPSRSTLAVDFHYGEMTLASCFVNGRAAVAYNSDFALIGINGQKIRKLYETEFLQTYKNNNSAPKEENGFDIAKNYVEYQENDYYGLKQGNDIIANAQFTSFPAQYADGYVVAEINNRQGVLSVIEGAYALALQSASGSKHELNVNKNGNAEPVNLAISLPERRSSRDNLKLMIDYGDGVMHDITSQLSVNAKSTTLSVSPSVSSTAENCEIKAVLENEGIIAAETSRDFALQYPVRMRVMQPGPAFIRANEYDRAVFSSTVFNDSNKAVEVTATWSTGGEETKTIAAHDKAVFSESIKVTENHTRHIKITLNTGESNSRSIQFQTFF